MQAKITRRKALRVGAAAAALPLVHIRTAGAAGKLTCALWDHWVPGGNDAMRKVVAAWADKNKVDVQVDFLTAIGNKINITMAAEAQAKTGHDIYAFDMWTVHEFADSLVSVDDLMKTFISKYGKIGRAYEYLGKANGSWKAIPVAWGSAPLTPCARMSMFKKYANVDLQAWFPAHPSTPEASKDWTYDTQLKIAEACAKAGYPFGFGCGQTTDSNQTWGSMFGGFGADLVDEAGNITVDSDNVKEAMEYAQRMVPFLPNDTVSYDDASNNRALISGKSAMIYNPPSAWAVAKRDAPQIAEDCWTFPNPRGPKGRMVPMRPYFFGIWSFAQNQSAAKELLAYLGSREQMEALTTAVSGYDIPPYLSMSDFKIWEEVEPPKGVVYNYPIRPWHDAEYYVTGWSGPPEIGVLAWNRGLIPTMVSKLVAGQTIKQATDWAKDELEGFRR
ncbi:ABC transporter substrate-binding protein [Rhodopila sp.]|jgi:ABC-type glycerol-3-phosphate transport system substrate-binding protein|uniref:ABC transporter substrate-binding protein n=1 Tax=Rhodopila sp. TaxID=2480087 RepID=UPI002B9166D7|nr:extracellular solute-binding protein [Rhodopila sp.]HVZ07544.1 extracellular solute-binding protein [Rhodopila sp.]